MYSILRKLLFAFDAEKAHHLSLHGLKMAHSLGLARLALPSVIDLPVHWMGLTLKNPVGLAAGLDKNGAYLDALAAMGFGFIEIGTVTPRPQAGNPQPRLFRLPENHAIINRMGFNNHGIDTLIENIKKSHYDGILGINIGKNATTPIEDAVNDYLICLEKAYPYASYITINISSPNTQNLRDLQQEKALLHLLGSLKARAKTLAGAQQKIVPLAVKIAPDLTHEQVIAIAHVCREAGIDGVIATNTTIHKEALGNNPLAKEAGGLSGAPLKGSADSVLKTLSEHLNPENVTPIPILGVGGIMTGQDAVDKIRYGATAVQLYSGLIYRGPGLIHECVEALRPVMNRTQC